jgi:hypothetical protein
MMEEDYLAVQKNNVRVGTTLAVAQNKRAGASPAPTLNPGTESFKTHILPLIQTEINTGSNFAQLRQIYHAFILASWFKKKLKDSIYKYYINQKKIKGIDLIDKTIKEKIYNQYVEAFKKGAYNYVKRECIGTQHFASLHTITKRRYFSGGIALEGQTVVEYPQPEVVAGLARQLRAGAVELVGATKDPFASDSAARIFNIAFGLTAAPELARTLTKIARPIANIDIDSKLRLYGYEFTGRNVGDKITCSSSCLIDPAIPGNHFGLYRRHVLVLPKALEDKENPLTREIVLFINQFISSFEKAGDSALAELLAQALVVWYLNPGPDELTPRQNYLLKIFAGNAIAAQALLEKTRENLARIVIIKPFSSPEIASAYAQNQELFTQRLKKIIDAGLPPVLPATELPAPDDGDTVIISSEPPIAPLPEPVEPKPDPSAMPLAPKDKHKARLLADTYFEKIAFGAATPEQEAITKLYQSKPDPALIKLFANLFTQAAGNIGRNFGLSGKKLVWFKANQAAFCMAIRDLDILPEEIAKNATTMRVIREILDTASEKEKRAAPSPGATIAAKDARTVNKKSTPAKKVTNALPLAPISFSAVMVFVKKYCNSVEFGELTERQTSLIEAYREKPDPALAAQLKDNLGLASQNITRRLPGLTQDEMEWFHSNQQAFCNELKSALKTKNNPDQTPTTAPLAGTPIPPMLATAPVAKSTSNDLPLAPHYSGDETRLAEAYYTTVASGALTPEQNAFVGLSRAQTKLSPQRRKEAMVIFRYAYNNIRRTFEILGDEKKKRWLKGNQAALCQALLDLGILPENTSTDTTRLAKIEAALRTALASKREETPAPLPKADDNPKPAAPAAPVTPVKFTRIPFGVPWKAPATPKDNREVEKFMLACWKQSVSPDALSPEQRHFIALALEEPNTGLENRLRGMFNLAVENIEANFPCFEGHTNWPLWFWTNQATFCQYLIALQIIETSEIPGAMAKIKRYAPNTPDLKLNPEDGADDGGIILSENNLAVQDEDTSSFVVSEETALRFKNTPVVSYKILFF